MFKKRDQTIALKNDSHHSSRVFACCLWIKRNFVNWLKGIRCKSRAKKGSLLDIPTGHEIQEPAKNKITEEDERNKIFRE